MPVTEIELYEVLKEKVGEKEARTIVEFIDAKIEKRIEEKRDFLATKDDIKKLEGSIIATKDDIKKLEIDIKRLEGDIKKLEGDIRKVDEDVIKIKEDLKELRKDVQNLEDRLEGTKSKIIKWMFLFWIGQFASLIAVLQIFFKR
ncbi:MAG: hypothetical protein N2257_03615 [Thermodesulfovibrionales bacterium]|nr:hypothetical protein [Thermodesulfovibrionales bacterium]